jgi:hypothetical protein
MALVAFVAAILYGRSGSDAATCAGIGVALHFTVLSAFCWMLAEGLALRRAFVVVFLDTASSSSCLYQYAAFAYGAPAVVVTVLLAGWSSEYGSSQATGVCWLHAGHTGAAWALIGPAAALCVANCALLVNLLWNLASTVDPTIRVHLRVSAAFSGCCGLDFLIMVPMMDTRGEMHTAYAYVFAVFNVLCGLMIFAYHGGLDANLWRQAITGGGEMLPNLCTHGENIVSRDGRPTQKPRRTNIIELSMPNGGTTVMDTRPLTTMSAPWRRRASIDDFGLRQPEQLASTAAVQTPATAGSATVVVDHLAVPNQVRLAPAQPRPAGRLGIGCRTSSVWRAAMHISTKD